MRSSSYLLTTAALMAVLASATARSESLTVQNGQTVTPYPGVYGENYRYYGCQDAVLDPAQPTANLGRLAEHGLVGGTDRKVVILFRELNRALGPNKSILAATLRLHVAQPWATGNEVRVYRLLAPWRQGSMAAVPQPQHWACSWEYRLYSADPTEALAWDVPGASGAGTDRAATPTVVADTGSGYAGGVWEIGGLGADVAEFYASRSANFGWVIEYANPAATVGSNLFYSSEAADLALRPELVITYGDDASPPARDVDLDVTYIERSPEYLRYEPAYEYQVFHDDNTGVMKDPGYAAEQKWPNNGDVVTFTAHVINKGLTAPTGPFSYRWLINGEVVDADADTVGLAPDEEGTYTLDWVWSANDFAGDADLHCKSRDHRDRVVTFEVDYDDLIAEQSESNNSLSDFIEGLAMGFYAEQTMYGYFNDFQNQTGSYSFEDWIQWQVRVWNESFLEMSRYAGFAEDGSLERVRIQRIVVVPDGDLCAGGNHNINCQSDFLLDGEWGFRSDFDYALKWTKLIEWGLLHESTHQLGVIDLYAMNMESGTPSNPTKVQIKDGGDYFITRGYYPPFGGLMGGGDTRYNTDYEASGLMSGWTVGALNGSIGYRRGYYGEQLYDLPETVALRVVDVSGVPIPHAEVKIWQSNGGLTREVRDWSQSPPYVYTWQPIVETVADADGVITLPDVGTMESGPFTTLTGHTLRDNPWGRINVVGTNGSLLVKVTAHGQRDFHFLRISQINRAYWSGHTSTYTYDVPTEITPVQVGPTNIAEGKTATASGGSPWLAVDGDPDTRWDVGNAQVGAFIQVDLGAAYDVAQVVLFQNGWGGDFFNQFRIETSLTGSFAGEQTLFAREPLNWGLACGNRRDMDPADPQQDALWVTYAALPTEARYVRITCEEAHWTKLAELRVYAADGLSPPKAYDVQATTPANTPMNVTLEGVSYYGEPLTYVITSLPSDGTLSGPVAGAIAAVPYSLTGQVVRYAPTTGYNGPDAFSYLVNDGQDSPAADVSIDVGGLAQIYSFPLDADPGWTTEGLWAFGQPSGGSGTAGGPDPTSGHTGPYAYGYNLVGGYEAEMPERHLTTTPIDCSGLEDVKVRFRRWLGVEGSSHDHARFSVSVNGIDWYGVWANGTATLDDGSWRSQEYNLAWIADDEPAVYLRWTMGTADAENEYCGWNVDDVEIWALVAGIVDCNTNGVLDDQDIAGGTSLDCNNNGVPDECDLALEMSRDCNTNGVPDECDIAGSTSVDLDENGVPDECEAPPEWCLGDLNCSGGMPRFDDINYFVAALSGESVWYQYYRDRHAAADPPCPWLLADYNGGGVEFTDIVPFANSIGQSCIVYSP